MGSRHPVRMESIELAAVLVAPSDFQNFFPSLEAPGVPEEAPGASREGKKFRLDSFEPAVGRRTDRLHFYRVGGRPGPSRLVKQE